MTAYRTALPQLGGDLFLTDGGLETTLIFHDGIELPDFAAFVLLKDAAGTAAQTAADMVCAITMSYVEEAIGITRAAQRAGMPVAVSFTVETDGRLPTGQTLQNAIEPVDQAAAGYPSYYMINCAHPTHFAHVLAEPAPFVQRIHGLRANASRMSHAELNEASALDIGDPAELGGEYAAFKRRLGHLNVLGGCCGTDHRHIEQIAAACVPLFK